MSKKLSIFTLLVIFATNLFADDQKTIEVNQFLYAPVEIKMSYRDATDFCSNLTANSEKGWRLAESYADLRPIWRTEKDKTNWTRKDVSFSYNPNEPHFFYCMKDSTKEAKIKTVGKTKHYVQPQALQQKSATEESQKNWLEEKRKMDERSIRVIKESNEYQESLKGNLAEKPNTSDGSIESKSSIQTKKRMFKDSTLPDCNDQNLTYCYARLKINTGTFEGELGNGTFEGKGLIVRNNGGAFMGDFRNNEFISGLDIYSNANDFFKLGDEARKKNLPAGDLLNYVFENFKGRYYAGSFVNNKREGKGIYIDTIEGFSQNGSWKNDEFVSGDTERFGQNNSNQNTPMSRAQSQCDGYGFQKGTNPYAQCIMQMDQLIRQQDYEQQRRANIEFQCRMQKANSFLSYQTPFFVESLNRADQVYNNCMAGLPPPRSGKIDCTISGSNVYCQER